MFSIYINGQTNTVSGLMNNMNENKISTGKETKMADYHNMPASGIISQESAFISNLTANQNAAKAYCYAVVTFSSLTEGTYSFNLETPNDLTPIGPGLPQFLSAATWANNKWYACGYNGNFGIVNPETGSFSIIGAPVGTVNGLAYDVTSNTIYGIDDYYLYTIDSVTGNKTEINTLATNASHAPQMINLACDREGQLYAVDIGSDSLFLINKTTADITAVDYIGMNVSYAQDMEFNLMDNKLYMAAYQGGGVSGLYLVNTETAELTKIGDMQNAEILGFAIPWRKISVTFTVTDNLIPVSNCMVTLGTKSLQTNASGVAVFSDLWPGVFDYSVSQNGNTTQEGQVTLEFDDIIEPVNFSSTGIHSMENNVSVFPNPACNSITIKNERNAVIRVFNTNGYLVKSAENKDTEHTIDVSDLPKGLYIIRIINDYSTIEKIVCIN